MTTIRLWWRYLKCWIKSRHANRWVTRHWSICLICACACNRWPLAAIREDTQKREVDFTPWWQIPFAKKLKLYKKEG